MRIGLLFDRMGVEEDFFLNMDYPIEKINSSNLIIDGSPLDSFDVIINRIESKYRRKKLSKFFEVYGTEVINNYSIEEVCGSKIETKIALNLSGVPSGKTIFKFGFPFSKRGNKIVKRVTEINRLKRIIKELKPCISKPDLGSRGKSIILIEDEGKLEEIFDKYDNFDDIPETFKSTLISPEGVLVEEYNPHALDLRVVVYKPKNAGSRVFGTLVRAVPEESILAKNTSLGGVPIGVPSIKKVDEIAVKAMEAIQKYTNRIYSKKLEYYIVGVDILPRNDSLNARNKIYESVKRLKKYMDKITAAKKTKKNTVIDNAFEIFKKSEEYQKAQEACIEYINNSTLLVTEINTTPDFGINTRNLIGNLITCYDKIIKSILH
ncbi:MAG: YheC/YheD family protein [Candidatus Odinarchaeia archaeon]